MTKSTGAMTARRSVRPQVLDCLVNTLLTQQEIAELTGVNQSTVTRWGEEILGQRFMMQRTALQFERKRVTKLAAMNDYPLVRTPDWFKGYSNQGRSFEHQVVYCSANSLLRVPRGYHIHHKNANRQDNRIENLEMLTSSDHATLHMTEK